MAEDDVDDILLGQEGIRCGWWAGRVRMSCFVGNDTVAVQQAESVRDWWERKL